MLLTMLVVKAVHHAHKAGARVRHAVAKTRVNRQVFTRPESAAALWTLQRRQHLLGLARAQPGDKLQQMACSGAARKK
jgi:hypothetical protein